MDVVRGKIERLRFIPDSELRVQYVDDENTFINLRVNDSFMDALRCAITVPGATLPRLKINILWQPKSTPEMISAKRREMRENTADNSSAESKKQLNFEKSGSPTNFAPKKTEPTESVLATSMFDCESTTSPPPPPRKQQRIKDGFARHDSQCKECTMSAHSTKYMSPLDPLIIDKRKKSGRAKENRLPKREGS